MSLPYFEAILEGGLNRSPERMYLENQQALQNDQWENTPIMEDILEQDTIGPLKFHKVEAWLAPVVGITSTGSKEGKDFLKLVFRDIKHPCIRGRLYKYDNNYWMGDYTDITKSVQKYMTVRRCNNYLRCIDPENGSVFSFPCVIDYDMTSPSIQVSSYVITPNNCAHVMVQANADTERLFTLNKRFILAGRPFKLYAFQNAMMVDDENSRPTLLYFDMYLDEIHDGDDIVNQIADNGEYNYSIKISSTTTQVQKGASGVLDANVTLNGLAVERDCIWKTNNIDVITIDENGQYRVWGEVGQQATITAELKGNKVVIDSITFEVVEQSEITPIIIIDNLPDKIRQYETITVKITASYGDKVYQDVQANISLSSDKEILTSDYLVVKKTGNNIFDITCLKFTDEAQNLYVSITNADPAFEGQQVFSIEAVNMFG